jgi:hypothetical protein
MPPSIGFVAYPSQPDLIGEAIEAGLQFYAQRHGAGRFTSWKENDVAGRFLADPILENIAASKCLVADVSVLNFNVAYEVGYAIGIGRRIVLMRNRSIASDETEFRRVGVFDTLGYLIYENGEGLCQNLEGVNDFAPLQIAAAINTAAPVWILQLPFNTEAQVRLVARVKRARLRFRSFDPSEQSRLAANDAIESIASSHGVIVPLAAAAMTDASIHNLRAAFAAGLAHGMGKLTLILQGGEDPVPLDYRDLVKSYRHPDQIDEYVADFGSGVTDALQSSARIQPTKGGLLATLDMGSSTAENEFANLGQYYLQTDEFRRALRGEVRIVVGRKGAGKTAVFAQVRDHIREDKARVVLDLKPEGYQLRKFKEQILDFLEAGTAEHTITAFWEYLLLLEVCYKLLEKDRASHMRDHRLFGQYQELARIYAGDGYAQEGDFSERMLRLVDQVAETFRHKYPDAQNLRLDQRQVTELLYLHDLRTLRSAIEDYLRRKRDLWILFDNLDKGWATHGLAPEDLLIVRCLLDASRKIEQSMGARDIECHTVIFIRNDVYLLLLDATPDRGKEIRVSLDWSEPDLLRQMLHRRLVYNGLPKDAPFEQIWRTICVALVDGEESSQYLIDRSLMRPRFLLNLISHCRGFAVNFEHDKIEAEDVAKGLASYSTDLIYDIDLEIRDILPFAEDVLYAFIGQPARLPLSRMEELLKGLGLDADQVSKVLDILLWYGVLGVVRGDGEIAYIYSVNYDMKRLKALLAAQKTAQQSLMISPAFWSGLEIAG